MHIVDAQEKQRKRPGVADDRKHTFFNNNKKKSKTSAAFSPGWMVDTPLCKLPSVMRGVMMRDAHKVYINNIKTISNTSAVSPTGWVVDTKLTKIACWDTSFAKNKQQVTSRLPINDEEETQENVRNLEK